MVKVSNEIRFVNVIYNFFKHFEVWCGRSPVTPDASELEKYFSKNLQMINNGQLVVKGGANYMARLHKFQQLYSNFKVSAPLEKPLISGNHVSIYYQIDLTTHSNQQKQIFVMGLFTIEEDKISRWVEVTHEKGLENWDK